MNMIVSQTKALITFKNQIIQHNIFNNYKFEKIDFALPLTVDDLDDVIGEDSPFIKNGDFIEFKKAVTAAESIFCYGESGGMSLCNYFIVNIAY